MGQGAHTKAEQKGFVNTLLNNFTSPQKTDVEDPSC